MRTDIEWSSGPGVRVSAASIRHLPAQRGRPEAGAQSGTIAFSDPAVRRRRWAIVYRRSRPHTAGAQGLWRKLSRAWLRPGNIPDELSIDSTQIEAHRSAAGRKTDAPQEIGLRQCRHAYPLSRIVYRRRNVIERMFCRMMDWRRIAARYDRPARTPSQPSQSSQPSVSG